MANDVRLRLSRKHEDDVAELLGGHHSKSSGNQWHDAADGKHGRYDDLSFAWDCKCVLPGTKSITVTRDDIAKITEQARGRKPSLPMRFYESERGLFLPPFDLILIRLQDFAELRERALS